MNSIINTKPPTPPTAAELLQDRAEYLASQQNSAARQVAQAYKQTSLFIWKDPTKAQAAFDAFTAAGFVGADLFVNALVYEAVQVILTAGWPALAKISAAIASIGTPPASPVPAGWTYTIDAAGKVTVVAPTPPSPKPSPVPTPAPAPATKPT